MIGLLEKMRRKREAKKVSRTVDYVVEFFRQQPFIITTPGAHGWPLITYDQVTEIEEDLEGTGFAIALGLANGEEALSEMDEKHPTVVVYAINIPFLWQDIKNAFAVMDPTAFDLIHARKMCKEQLEKEHGLVLQD